MLAKILFWWGASVLALLFGFALLAVLIESYTKGGVAAVLFGFVLLSALPAIIVGIVWGED